MTTPPAAIPPRLPAPAETLVVAPDGTVLLAVDGILTLPLGARVRYDVGRDEATVIGTRLDRVDAVTLQLIIDVDAGGSGLEAALEEVDAEAQVVEAAEEIASSPAPLEGEPAVPGIQGLGLGTSSIR